MTRVAFNPESANRTQFDDSAISYSIAEVINSLDYILKVMAKV